MKRLPLVDLRAQHRAIADEVMEAVRSVIEGQAFILGEPVAAFERSLAERVGASHAVGVASCTDALRLALVGLGVGPGDAVLTTPLTFVASAEAIVRVGAVPVFCDIEEDGFQLSPRAVEKAIAGWRGPERLRAILVVHLFGACADLEALSLLARKHDLRLVEDVAQAMGATRDGHRAGSVGDAGCFSFFPAKTLGGWGDGGALVTSDGALAARVRRLRQHGVEGGRVMEIGENSRLDALHAAVLQVKLRHLGTWIEARRALARRYADLFGGHPRVRVPTEVGEATFNPYVIRVQQRERVLAALREASIEARAYYDRPLPDEPAFAQTRHVREPLPNAERAAGEILALPLFPEMTAEDQSRVADTVLGTFE